MVDDDFCLNYKIQSELEDLSLRYYRPDIYFGIVETLNKTKQERDLIVNEMLENVSSLLKEHGIKHEIKGRAKSIYSIYKKMDKFSIQKGFVELNFQEDIVNKLIPKNWLSSSSFKIQREKERFREKVLPS